MDAVDEKSHQILPVSPSPSPPLTAVSPPLSPRLPRRRRRCGRKTPSPPLPAGQGPVSPAERKPTVGNRKKNPVLTGSPVVSPRARRKLGKRGDVEMRKVESLEGDLGRGLKRGKCCGESTLAPAVESCAVLQDEDNAADLDSGNIDWLLENISEIIMWKNVAKSTLCFGLGSTFILTSSLARGSDFSIVSAMSQLGLLILAIEFLRDYCRERQQLEWKQNLRLTEADIHHVAQFILPAANYALAKVQEIFSGDPLMTLKVAPVLVFGAKYGHLITLWRLFTTGFIASFTVPKLYSCYAQQIKSSAESIKSRVEEVWRACPRKKLMAASAATFFWNTFSKKTCIFAGFISLVLFRYQNQQVGAETNKRRKVE